MLRVVTSMLFAVVAVVFGAQNWENVPVNLLLGQPTRVRLVFLMLIAMGAGYVVAFVQGLGREIRVRAENRVLRRRLRSYETVSVEVTAAEDEPERRASRPRVGSGKVRRRLVETVDEELPEETVIDVSDSDEEDEPAEARKVSWRGRKARS